MLDTYDSYSYEDTKSVAAELVRDLEPGSIIALTADLGCGKSAFAQGVAEGLGVVEHTSSPTFTIVQVYESGRLPLYHFDVYRIEDIYELVETGFDDYIFGDGISVIEWADMIEEVLPDSVINVTITKDLSKGEDYRHISILR